MSTQLSVATAVNMESLQSLAKEFKRHFEVSSEQIHERLAGKKFIFNYDGKEAYPFAGWDEGIAKLEGEARPIRPTETEATIASTDSSCILLGESREGSVYAVRAAVCFTCGGLVRGYFRIGPTIIYLSPRGACGLPGDLESYELRVALTDHLIAERLIRNTVEKRMVTSLLASPQLSVVMADGSLKHPFDAYPPDTMALAAKGTCLVGFSKSSALVSSGEITGLVSRAKGAAYFPSDDGLGPIETVVAKFSHDGLVFRVDVAASHRKTGEVLGTIAANDAFCVGYPESLRVAHHLSVFSRSEDTALKAYLAKRYALRHLPSFGLRRMTLGGMSNSG